MSFRTERKRSEESLVALQRLLAALEMAWHAVRSYPLEAPSNWQPDSGLSDERGVPDMDAFKQTKWTWPGSLIILTVLVSLLALPACQLVNPLSGQSFIPQPTPFSSNFPLALKWQHNLDATSVLSPRAWGDVLIMRGNSLLRNQLYALDMRSGDSLWERDGHLILGAWLSEQGKLIVGVGQSIQVLNIRTGELLWSAPSFSQVSNITYSEGRVFVQVSRSTFRAYDLETGQMLWQSSVEQQSTIHYDARHQSLIAIPLTHPGNYSWLDPISGRLLRTEENKVPARSFPGTWPIVENGKIYEGALVIDATTGTPLCIHPESGGDLVPGANGDYDLPLIGDMLYISTESKVVAFDTVTCQPRWQYQPRGTSGRGQPKVVSNPAVLNGIVYAIFSDATVRAVDQQSGQEIGYWQATTVKYSFSDNSAIPGVAVSNDTLVASFGNGQIYAFGP